MEGSENENRMKTSSNYIKALSALPQRVQRQVEEAIEAFFGHLIGRPANVEISCQKGHKNLRIVRVDGVLLTLAKRRGVLVLEDVSVEPVYRLGPLNRGPYRATYRLPNGRLSQVVVDDVSEAIAYQEANEMARRIYAERYPMTLGFGVRMRQSPSKGVLYKSALYSRIYMVLK